MKKFFALSLVLMLAFCGVSSAASTYRYTITVEDQFGDQITSGATVYVKTVNTNTNASVWPSDDTSTGTLTGVVAPDSHGKSLWYSTASSHDVVVQYHGTAYLYKGVTPGSDRRVQVNKFDPPIDLDTTDVVASGDTTTLPIVGKFFRVTGTTNINNISSTGAQVGRRVTLLFAGDLQIGQNGNITVSQKFGGMTYNWNMSGTLTCGAGTVIDLIYDGTKWRVV